MPKSLQAAGDYNRAQLIAISETQANVDGGGEQAACTSESERRVRVRAGAVEVTEAGDSDKQ